MRAIFGRMPTPPAPPICATCCKPIEDANCHGAPGVGCWHLACDAPAQAVAANGGERLQLAADGGTPFAWFHRCAREGPHFVGHDEPCNWCGGRYEDEPHNDDAEAERHLRRVLYGE